MALTPNINSALIGLAAATALPLMVISTDRVYSEPAQPTAIASLETRVSRLEQLVEHSTITVEGGDATVNVMSDGVAHRLLVAEYTRQMKDEIDGRLHRASSGD